MAVFVWVKYFTFGQKECLDYRDTTDIIMIHSKLSHRSEMVLVHVSLQSRSQAFRGSTVLLLSVVK